MKLTVAHQILIASAIGLCAIFGLRSIVIGVRTSSGLSIGLGVVSLLAFAGLWVYLKRFREKLAAKSKDQR